MVPTLAIFAATSTLSVTLALALMTAFLFTHIEGIRHNGAVAALPELVPDVQGDVPADRAARDPRSVHAPDQPVGRLYANMLAGHMLILTFIGLIFVLENVFLA